MIYRLNSKNISFEYAKSKEKVFISSQFKDKDVVKSWGAKWDPELKKWWMPRETFDYFFHWLREMEGFSEDYPPPQSMENAVYIHKDLPLVFTIFEDIAGGREFAAVVSPFAYRADFKELGFYWNHEIRAWCTPGVEDGLVLFDGKLTEIAPTKKPPEEPKPTKKPTKKPKRKLEKTQSPLLKEEVVLYPFQEESKRYLQDKEYVLLCEDMGSGKSLICISSMLPYIEEKAFIICPAFLKYNWKSEVLKFTHIPEEEIHLCKTKKDGERYNKNKHKILIANYEMVRSGVFNECFGDFQTIICDEFHKCCNTSTQITETLSFLVKKHRPTRFWGATGTPVQNRVPELYSLLNFMSVCPSRKNGVNVKERFLSFDKFCSHFSHKSLRTFGRRTVVKWDGVKNVSELKKLLEGKYIRHDIKEHLDLPDSRWIHIEIDSVSKHRMQEISDDLTAAWEGHIRGMEGEEEESISTVKARTALLKVPATVEQAMSVLEQGDDEQVVIFSDHRTPVDTIFDALQKKKIPCGKIYGGTDIEERQKLVDLFQSGKIKALVCTIPAAGVGLTLTKANKMIFNDLAWVPASNKQAEKRILRIGQRNNCIFYSMVFRGIDALIAKTLKAKEETINQIF